MVALAIIGTICGLLFLAVVVWLIGERGCRIRPSTRRAIRRYGGWRFLHPQIWHFYVYGCWPRQYIRLLIRSFAHLGKGLRQRLANGYHGKVLTHEHARRLLTLERPLPLQDLEQIVPYPLARRLLLEGPPDVVVFECPCRLNRPQPCQPTQVCMIVGQPFVDLVLDHHPRTSRRLTQTEALALLHAERDRGHVHIAWFKHACLDRFFAICNCCKCCCAGIEGMVRFGIPMIAASGYVADVNPKRCLACGRCEEACPFAAVHVENVAIVDHQACQGCGVCVSHCGGEAIHLERDASKGTPLDVHLLA